MRRALLVLLAALLAAPAASAWSWPVEGRVLAPFVFDPANPYAAGQHRGVDVAGSVGDPVRAPAAGTVSFAGAVPGSGRSVTIETADGWSVTLTHLGQVATRRGASVGEGDVVGTVGEPDAGTTPYVQLGIRRTADPQGYVDPLGLLPGRPAAAAPAPPPAQAALQPAGAPAPLAPPAPAPGAAAPAPAPVAPAPAAPAPAAPAPGAAAGPAGTASA